MIKRVRKITILLTIIFVVLGVVLQLFCFIKTKDKKNVEEKKEEQEEVFDVFNATTKDELYSIAKETGVTVEENEANKNYLDIIGYKFMDKDTYLTVKYSENELLEFQGEFYPVERLNKDVEGGAEMLKETSANALNVFAKRFHVSTDSFSIRKYDGSDFYTMDTNDMASYQTILNNDAELCWYVKDKDGNVWGIRAKQNDFGNIMFELSKYMGKQTENMYNNLDLSSIIETNGQ